MVHTLEALDPFQCNPQQGILDVAARLEGASIGVNVDVAHRPLDADAAVWGAPGVGVQDVHELGVISGQSALVICMLEGGTSRIQTLGWRKGEWRICFTLKLSDCTLKNLSARLIWPLCAMCSSAEPLRLRNNVKQRLWASNGLLLSQQTHHYSNQVRVISKLDKLHSDKSGGLDLLTGYMHTHNTGLECNGRQIIFHLRVSRAGLEGKVLVHYSTGQSLSSRLKCTRHMVVTRLIHL